MKRKNIFVAISTIITYTSKITQLTIIIILISAYFLVYEYVIMFVLDIVTRKDFIFTLKARISPFTS